MRFIGIDLRELGLGGLDAVQVARQRIERDRLRGGRKRRGSDGQRGGGEHEKGASVHAPNLGTLQARCIRQAAGA
jgi:hypothetical protein